MEGVTEVVTGIEGELVKLGVTEGVADVEEELDGLGLGETDGDAHGRILQTEFIMESTSKSAFRVLPRRRRMYI